MEGAARMGKTSLLLQVPAHLEDGFVPVRLSLRDEHPQRLDRLAWRMAEAVVGQLRFLLPAEFAEPNSADFYEHPSQFVDALWPDIRERLNGLRVVLLVDDLDSLSAGNPGLCEGLLELAGRWLRCDPATAVVATARGGLRERVGEAGAALLSGWLFYSLGPLTSEEAVHLMTWPVDGVLTYDYGVPRRLAEIASGHPYYLQLLCYEVFDRCARAGWVNQRDVDTVVEAFVGRDTPEFQEMWERSDAQERLMLAAIVSQRGTRGVATAREVEEILAKAGMRAEPAQVTAALDRLVARDILERPGAQAYRFRVALARDWLGRRISFGEVTRSARWPQQAWSQQEVERGAGRREARSQRREGNGQAAPGDGSTTERAAPSSLRRSWLWILLFSLATVAAVAALALDLWPSVGQKVAPSTVVLAPDTRTATPGPTVPLSAARASATTVRPAYTPIASPTASPTATAPPTAPLVISRPAPALAYLSREDRQAPWAVYIMTSEGTDRRRLVEVASGFMSAPSWSPSGNQLALVSDADGEADIWVVSLDGSAAKNLTRDSAQDHSPAWSPDGGAIAFASLRDSARWELYLMRPDGSDVQRLTWWDDASDLSPSWSPDGSRIAFASKRDGNWELYSVGRDGADLVRLTDHPAADTKPAWSPDGQWIAFQSERDGFTEIYVMPAAGGEAANLTRLSWATDLGPTWSPDGGRIAFYSDRDGDWDIYVMPREGGNAVKLTGDVSDDQLPAWRP